MSFPDKTPELPKFRRLTSGAMLQKRIGGLWTLRLSEGAEGSILAEGPNAQPGSASVPNGHSQPLQPLRRRLPPERLPEIGELLKNIGLDEADEEKENQPVKESAIESIARREMPPPQNSAKPFEMAVTPRLGFVEPEKPTMRMFAPMSKVLKVNGKDYMIIGGLGSGGSCEVYSALHEGQIVAIKDVTLPKEAAVKENYLREIQMLKKLSDCEQVVRLLDYEEGDGKILMVMEKGDSDLSAVLQRASKDWITVRFFWRDMLRAVERIHKLGIIHQDLKPANFIIVKGRLKLIDFGISDDIGDATSVFRDCAIGTFNYMSPEIIQQSRESSIKTSRASDIWSLGCILYSLAFGEPPFAHIKNMNNKVLAIVNPKHEISYPADADPDLLDVLKRCLRRQPKERATAEELLKHDFVLGPPSIRSTYKNK